MRAGLGLSGPWDCDLSAGWLRPVGSRAYLNRIHSLLPASATSQQTIVSYSHANYEIIDSFFRDTIGFAPDSRQNGCAGSVLGAGIFARDLAAHPTRLP